MNTVGLDFGTHQTKICVEKIIEKQKVYEFVEFVDNDNKKTFFLPSVVQINNDKTVSYGFVDDTKCMRINFNGDNIISINSLKRPEFHLPEKPKLSEIPFLPIQETLPKRPTREEEVIERDSKIKTNDPNYLKLYQLKQKLLSQEIKSKKNLSKKETYKAHKKRIDDWDLKCKRIQENNKNNRIKWLKNEKRIREENEEKLNVWEKDCIKIKADYNERKLKYQSIIKKLYYINFNADGNLNSEKLNFRYFKFNSFFKSSLWHHQISSEKISIWYLTNIIFLLEQNYGDNFYTQLGIPTGDEIKDYMNKQNIGLTLLISAFKLRENYATHNDFLNENYYELLEKTIIHSQYSNDDLEVYGLNVIPEAYAGLISLTQSKKIVKGISLLVDIGGGTTDIGLFTIKKGLPLIYKVLSIDKGLNFISENSADFIKIKPNNQNLLFSNESKSNSSNSSLAEKLFIKELEEVTSKIIQQLRLIFKNSPNLNGLDISRLSRALDNRPIIFTGGGSNYKHLVRKINNFSDIKKITTDILPFGLFKQKVSDENLSILSTSFGLSIPLENEIEITSIDKIFNEIDFEKNDSNKDYIHGLTD